MAYNKNNIEFIFKDINGLDNILGKVGIHKIYKGYKALLTVNNNPIVLGKYNNRHDAKQAIINYKKQIILEDLKKYNLNLYEAKILNNTYLVFKEGYIYSIKYHKFIGHMHHKGYLDIIINKKTFRLHRIVAMAFIPNPNKYPCINHIDGNKLNNNISNLEWCTYSHNTQHAYDMGLEDKIKKRGENHPRSVLSEEQVKYIKENYKFRSREFGSGGLAKKIGVSVTAVESVICGKSWTWLSV